VTFSFIFNHLFGQKSDWAYHNCQRNYPLGT
jgi:hypothetical protein